MLRLAAILYALVAGGAVLFQLALACGAPLGDLAMGGAYPGSFPPALRVAAAVQAAIIAGLAAVVLARARLALPTWARVSRWAIWIVVAFSGLSTVLNVITPSSRERAIWAPVGMLMLVSSLVVALARAGSERSAADKNT